MITVQLDRDYEPNDFLENVLKPALQTSDKVEVAVHESVLLGRSWMDLVFGELVRSKYLTLDQFKDRVFLVTDVAMYKSAMLRSVADAQAAGLHLMPRILREGIKIAPPPYQFKLVLVYERKSAEYQTNVVIELLFDVNEMQTIVRNGALQLPYFTPVSSALHFLENYANTLPMLISYNVFSCDDSELEAQLEEIVCRNTQVLRGLLHGADVTIYDDIEEFKKLCVHAK